MRGEQLDCVVLAGGQLAPDDPLYAYTNGRPKALLDIGGRTMVERVIDALQGADSVGDIVLVGLESGLGLRFARPVHTVEDQGSLIANGLAGTKAVLERQPDARRLLICTADIPAVTSQVVDNLVASCQPLEHAAYYSMVDRQSMEARFPGSQRTFVKLKDMEVAGGDIVLADPRLAEKNRALIESLAGGRKQAWKLASIVGPRVLFRLLLRQLTVADIEQEATRILGRPVKVMISSHAELAMDVDKPLQADMLRAALAQPKDQ